MSETRYPENRTMVELDGIWGGGATYPGKPYCFDAKRAVRGVRRLNCEGEPEAVRRQTAADSRIVLRRQGQ